MPLDSQKIDPSSGQFIDPLFAVVVAAGVTETVVKWVTNSQVPSALQIAITAVGYINLLLSWFGYHKSVYKRPIRGNLRFIVTVVLLPLYLLTIILYEKPMSYLSVVYASIFFLWSFWEYLKFKEHNIKRGFWELQFRFYNLPVYSSSAILFIVPALGFGQNSWFVYYANPLALALIVFSILWLRIEKSANEKGTPASKIMEGIENFLLGTDQQNP